MATYSGKQFEAYVGIATQNIGSETPAGTLYKMRMPSVSDIDFSGGVQLEDVERTGQRVLRPTDHIAVRGGGTYSWSFSDYVVENEAMLQLLLQLATEDTSPDATAQITGNQATVAYTEGASLGEYANIVINSPDTDKDRLMHSAVLQELTLSLDPSAHGGRLTASGTFWSGFQPVIGSESTSPNATAVDYTKGFFDCSTQTLAGGAVYMNKFDITISNPATRTGFKTVNSNLGEPESYNRGGQISVTGNVGVKMDDNSVTMVDNFLAGTSTNISIGDGSTIDFDVPTAKFTGHDLDLGNESGAFINLPFMGTAEAAGALVTIIAT